MLHKRTNTRGAKETEEEEEEMGKSTDSCFFGRALKRLHRDARNAIVVQIGFTQTL